MRNIQGAGGPHSMHVGNVHRSFEPGHAIPGSRVLAVVAAGVAGFLIMIAASAAFVSLPSPGGSSRFGLARYSELQRTEDSTTGNFQLLGPFRVTPRSVAFSWVAPGDSLFRSYEVHYSQTPRFAPSRLTLYAEPITTPSATSIEVANLQCATTYFFKVRLNTRDGRFKDSSELVARTGACPDTARLSWLESRRREDAWYGSGAEYDDYGDNEGGWGSGDTDSLYTADNSSAYGSYSRDDSTWLSGSSSQTAESRRAGSGDSEDSGSDEQAATLFPPAFITAASGDIVWSEDCSDQFRSYEVHVSRSSRFRPSPLTQRGPGLTNRYRSRMKLDGLQCGSTYFVRIRTAYRDGRTVDSNEESFTTPPCDSPRGSPTSQGP